MTKRERVLAAFNNRPVDHVPSGFWFHFPENQISNEQVVTNHVKYYKEIDADMIKIMSDGYFDYPHKDIAKIKHASEWRYLEPLGENDSFITKQVDRCKMLKERLKDECCMFYNVFNPMSYLRFAISEERLMHDLMEDEGAVVHAFAVIAEDAATICEKVIKEAGCEGVYFCLQNGEETRFTEEAYKRIVAPSEKMVLARANKAGQNNILHCCGWAGEKNRLSLWKDYDAKVINWAVFVENMDLVEGKKFFGGRCVLGGFDNTDQGVLLNGTRKEVEDYTFKLLDKSGTTGVILGGDCTFPRGTDVTRFRWVMDAAEKYAKEK